MNYTNFRKWMKEFSKEWDNICEKLKNSGVKLENVEIVPSDRSREDE